MSNQERASWGLLAVNLVVGVWYFAVMFSLPTDLGPRLDVVIPLLIELTIVGIVVATAGEILMHVLAGAPSDAVATDERDRLINLKAQRNGYFVLVVAVTALVVVQVTAANFAQYSDRPAATVVGGFLQNVGRGFFIANLLLCALVLAEVAMQGSRVFYYRRGH